MCKCYVPCFTVCKLILKPCEFVYTQRICNSAAPNKYVRLVLTHRPEPDQVLWLYCTEPAVCSCLVVRVSPPSFFTNFVFSNLQNLLLYVTSNFVFNAYYTVI